MSRCPPHRHQCERVLVTRTDIQRDFLENKLQADALDYIRCAIEVSGSEWLPIRYYARAAGLSHSELHSFIETLPEGLPAQKKLYKERLSSPDKAYVKATGPAATFLGRIQGGEEIVAGAVTEAREIAQAVQGLRRPLGLDPHLLRALLLRCFALISPSNNATAKTALRKATARFDELLDGA